ncbi:MAG: hypothetical protein WC322_07035, partial [Candidatus Paceibacterota bacterium]
MPTFNEAIQERHDPNAVNVGDIVVITRVAQSLAQGWSNYWVQEMDRYIGEACEVTRIDGARGVRLKTYPGGEPIDYSWPTQALGLPNRGAEIRRLFNLEHCPAGELRRDYRLFLPQGCYEDFSPADRLAAGKLTLENLAKKRFKAWDDARILRLQLKRNEIERNMDGGRDRVWRYAGLLSGVYDKGSTLRYFRADHKSKGRTTAVVAAKYRKALAAKDDAMALLYLAEMGYNASTWVSNKITDDAYSALWRLQSKTRDLPNLPWENEDWYVDSPHRARCAYPSQEAPGMVAYVESVDKLKRDIQTRVKPGRFLTKFFSDVLSEKEIKMWAERATAASEARSTLHFVESTDPDGWEWVYESAHNFSSCMMYDHPDERYLSEGLYGEYHPVRAYAYPGNGLRLAYIGDPVGTPGGRVYARAIVRDTKGYEGFIRVYGDSSIHALLEQAGYASTTSLKGVKVRKM